MVESYLDRISAVCGRKRNYAVAVGWRGPEMPLLEGVNP